MNKLILLLLAALAWVQPASAQFNAPGQRPGHPSAWLGCVYQSTLTTLLNLQSEPLQCDNKGSVFHVIRDAAGNARGANVDASNRLSVTVDNIAGSLTLGTITAVATVTNLAQMNGAALLMGNGVTGTGSQRVTIASDNTAFSVNAVQSGSWSLAANQSVNVAQMNGVTTTMGNGVAGTGVQRVAIVSDNTAFSVNAQYGGTALVADPCQAVAKSYTPISITAATTTRIIAPTSAKKTYICHITLIAAAADNVGIVEGTGGTCGTGTAGIVGGTTAASGPNFAANGGIMGGSGAAAIWATAGTNVDLCLITSAAVQLSGMVVWVQQ